MPFNLNVQMNKISCHFLDMCHSLMRSNSNGHNNYRGYYPQHWAASLTSLPTITDSISPSSPSGLMPAPSRGGERELQRPSAGLQTPDGSLVSGARPAASCPLVDPAWWCIYWAFVWQLCISPVALFRKVSLPEKYVPTSIWKLFYCQYMEKLFLDFLSL